MVEEEQFQACVPDSSWAVTLVCVLVCSFTPVNREQGHNVALCNSCCTLTANPHHLAQDPGSNTRYIVVRESVPDDPQKVLGKKIENEREREAGGKKQGSNE